MKSPSFKYIVKQQLYSRSFCFGCSDFELMSHINTLLGNGPRNRLIIREHKTADSNYIAPITVKFLLSGLTFFAKRTVSMRRECDVKLIDPRRLSRYVALL